MPITRFLSGAAIVAIASACAGYNHRGGAADAVSGEWVDLHKTTARDTMVWVLAPNGDDQLLHIAVGDQSTRRHFGRWSLADAGEGASARLLCFVRRPGRDAPSCIPFVLDTIPAGKGTLRRLRLRGYVGEQHTSDRELIERRPSTPAAPTPEASTQFPERASPPSESKAGDAGGFHPQAVQPERPSVATHAGTVAPGYAELETGVEHDRNPDGTSSSLVPSVLKVGLTKRLQLALQLPVLVATETPTGLGDVAIGMKWRLLEDDPVLQDIAVLPQLKLPYGGPRGSGTTDASLLVINSRTIGPVGLDLNIGVTRRSGDGSSAPRVATLWAVAAGAPIVGGWGWALECYGYPGTGGPSGAPPVVAVLTGPTLVLRPEVALDVGIIMPVSGPQPRAFYVGLVTSLGQFVSRRR